GGILTEILEKDKNALPDVVLRPTTDNYSRDRTVVENRAETVLKEIETVIQNSQQDPKNEDFIIVTRKKGKKKKIDKKIDIVLNTNRYKKARTF
ncbi:3980_t:CDS:1, partial [Scutellospora calospora]